MIVQMVGMVIILRVSRTQHVVGHRYLNTTVIVLSEMLKLLASLVLHWCGSKDFAQFRGVLWLHSGAKPLELAKTCIPSLLYTVQNNLLFVAISHLSAGTYQVTYQLKILSTAILSVLILGTKLSAVKWFALGLLTVGVMLVNAQHGEVSHREEKSKVIGLIAVLAACFTSGFAGVYIEKLLKQSNASIWIRNAQLGASGTLFAIVISLNADWKLICRHGFFVGYNRLVWVVVVWQALGGLIIAVVMKYADNIAKCFGCAIAIIFTCLFSVFELHESTPDLQSIAGASCVVVATGIYGLGLPTFVENATNSIYKLCKPRRKKRRIAEEDVEC